MNDNFRPRPSSLVAAAVALAIANGAQAGMYGVALDADGRILVAGQIGPLGANAAAGMARIWP